MSKILFHEDIFNKLEYFHKVGKIPNIVFHGPNGSGKRTILNKFINLIYNNDNNKIKSYVMLVNCAHGKGIKFIREELKFFAKTNISTNDGHIFKCVVLLNADKLTTDAQSALRRCIELYNHTTRFFLVVEDKYKLLKPILSRFCEIYVYQPIVNGNLTNLCKYEIEETFNLKKYNCQRQDWLKKDLSKMVFTRDNLLDFSTKIYEKGYCALDVVELFEQNKLSIKSKSDIIINEMLMAFNIIKNDIKNEKMLIYFVLYFLFIEKSLSLNTIISI
tara:strand:+ start:2727 stop:3551 length:825 start_codon:yes stop_codon:yes gene_type:complete